MTMDYTLRRYLQNGNKAIGSFSLGHDSEVVRVAAAAGLEFLIIDMEHGTPSPEMTARFIDAAKGSSLSLLVRCTLDDVPFLGGLFDRGLDGVIVAGAGTADDVRQVIDAVKFAPLGKRGLNPFVPAADYGTMAGPAFMEKENDRTTVWVIAENEQLIRQLDEIAGLDGLDGIFFGPYDLSVDLGIPGETNNPRVKGIIADSIQLIQKNGRSAGIFGKDAESVRQWADQGVSFLAVGFDWSHLMTAWKQLAEIYKE